MWLWSTPARVTLVALSLVARLPFASSMRTVTDGVIYAAAALFEGCTPKASLLAAPAVAPEVQLATAAMPLGSVVVVSLDSTPTNRVYRQPRRLF